jgi:hypothetical protein
MVRPLIGVHPRNETGRHRRRDAKEQRQEKSGQLVNAQCAVAHVEEVRQID